MADSNSTISSPQDLGLTPVHQAVLHHDLIQLITLIKSKEHGVDALDSRRATPMMLAALARRFTAFLFLLENGASRQRKDADGLDVVDYLLPTNIERLAQIYQPHAMRKHFSERRRKLVRAFCEAISESYREEDAARAEVVRDQEAPTPDLYETKDVILHQGNSVMFGTLAIHTKADFENGLHEKTMGAIRGRAKNSPFYVMSVSGWRGDKAEGTTVLNNTEYTLLVRKVSQMYGLVLNGNPLDFSFPGADDDKRGIYYCCHAERQLATWLVEESISRVLGEDSNGITVENISKLREKLDMLPTDLRETVIEVGQTPCKYCIEFVNLLRRKSGLDMHLNARPWFVTGKRKGLRTIDPSHVMLLKGRTSAFDANVFVNELGDDELEGILMDDVPTGYTNATSSTANETSGPHMQQFTLRQLPKKGASKRRRREKKDVNTKRYRQGPPVYFDPSEAGTSGDSSDNCLHSSPPSLNNNSNAATIAEALAATASAPPQEKDEDEDEEMNDQPLPFLHKQQASQPVQIASKSPAPSVDSSRANTPDSSEDEDEDDDDDEERERKRQRKVESFKNVVIKFAHVSHSESSDEPNTLQEQEQDALGVPEGFLENLTVTEPFPGASAFGLGGGE